MLSFVICAQIEVWAQHTAVLGSLCAYFLARQSPSEVAMFGTNVPVQSSNPKSVHTVYIWQFPARDTEELGGWMNKLLFFPKIPPMLNYYF